MVHSGSASPVTTTTSVSSHLTVPATAPPPQEALPLVPPSGETTRQDLTLPPAKLLNTDITFNSTELTGHSTLSPADAQRAGVTPEKVLAANSSPASSPSSALIPTPASGPLNGRTSGRKRTPKACDCCGPNSAGHNVQTLGRGRGRGRGAVKDPGNTPKRKASQLTHTNVFNLTNKKVEEAEDANNIQEKLQTPASVADTQSNTQPPLLVTSLQDGPMRNCTAPVEGGTMKNEDMLIEGSLITGEGGKGDGCNRDVDVSGMVGRKASVLRGRGGRGMKQAPSASRVKVEVGNRRPGGTVVIATKMDFPAQSVVVLSQENKDAELEPTEQTDSSTVKSVFVNGDTVNLSDSEPEEEAMDDGIIRSELGNGLQSISLLSGPGLRSGTIQDLDSHMQENKTPDKTDQDSVTLSNGNISTPTEDHRSTPMEVEACHPNSITVYRMQHLWALRDHRLYCQPGTWEEVEEMSGRDQSKEAGVDGQKQKEESLEQLTDLIHEFLESFYMKYGSFIPLAEADVLEHLKKSGNSDLSKWGLDIKGQMTRYRTGLASAPLAGFMVKHNKHSLSLDDLSTLEEQNWLNDQIINMYGELIMEATQQKVHFFNSFFHKQLVAKGYDGVKRWTKKVDLFSKWLLLIPIHLEIHWSLVTVTMATKTISYYDSQGIVFRHTTDNIMKYLQSEAKEKEQTAFQKGWKITIIKGIPQQKNDSDCGVFVLEYCRRLSVKQPLLFSQEDMPRIRKRIYKELCDCRLND